MPAQDNTEFQINLKTPLGTLINIYATDDSDLSTKLEQIEKVAPQIAALEGVFTAASNASGISAPPSRQTPGNPPSRPGNDPSSGSTPPGAAPSCMHGPRTYRSGVSKAGKPYKLWACTVRGSEQCDPQWIRD